MEKDIQLESALYAIHLILVELRTIAFTDGDMKTIGEVLDWAEAMPFMLAHPDEGRVRSFRQHLAAVANRDPRFNRVLQAFDSNRGFYGCLPVEANA